MPFIMLFWDGIGIGKKDPSVNPFFSSCLPVMDKLFGGQMPSLRSRSCHSRIADLIPIDANLGVSGLPQSGTGQATIFTGENCSKIVGRHFGPFVHSAIRPLLEEFNLFERLSHLGRSSQFVNAYPRQYFEFVESPRGRYPAVALASKSSHGFLRGYHELLAGDAISGDITGERWQKMGYPDILPVSPDAAGEKMFSISGKKDLTLFEFFLTDEIGHSQSMPQAVEILQRVDMFIGGIIEEMNMSRDTLCIVSDHGNIEDLSVKTHTRNPVPFIIIGEQRSFFTKRIRTLKDITPAILEFLR